ncbi:hypothetical protein [Rhizobium indicum]|uniref:Uncharacterized protein n=1 Tax=Rhizobium indicum TaxID=2583231 RepID=A0ABX6PGI0_9HYPH|nr:hypothetical protein [Rhizobium indicum]QKK17701.1 hypothetical protein FFM53_015200 [Rhizobium indicum]
MSALSLSNCGFVPPKLAEFWEARDVSDGMVLNIKRNIFCETIAAIRHVNAEKTNFGKPIPDDYGIQLQLTLDVAESTTFSPTLTATRTLRSGSQSGESIGRSLGLGLNATASSTATRTDTTYTYWQVGAISGRGKNVEYCETWPIDRRGSSPLLTSDLGIAKFLDDNVKPAILLPSTRPSGSKKPDKVDVYSYNIKFAVVTTGGISPSFKMVSLSGGGSPILDLNRTRTHELLLTFGPTGPDGYQPSPIALEQHLNIQRNQTLSRQPF